MNSTNSTDSFNSTNHDTVAPEFNWVEHELVIMTNAVNFALTFYYMLYEIFVMIFVMAHLPRLPTLWYIKGDFCKSLVGNLGFTSFKLIALLGAYLSMIASSNLSKGYLVVGWLLCAPFVAYDLFLLVFGNFYMIDVDDFLLFQTLLTSTGRFARIFATILNSILVYRFVI